mmetsp:Transcript_26520/g.76038  ORF Transcript_26520/g.76038 Transcript_26520/m.76038 type:complete len:234 (-) Transcript_26520:46-747(-)
MDERGGPVQCRLQRCQRLRVLAVEDKATVRFEVSVGESHHLARHGSGITLRRASQHTNHTLHALVLQPFEDGDPPLPPHVRCRRCWCGAAGIIIRRSARWRGFPLAATRSAACRFVALFSGLGVGRLCGVLVWFFSLWPCCCCCCCWWWWCCCFCSLLCCRVWGGGSLLQPRLFPGAGTRQDLRGDISDDLSMLCGRVQLVHDLVTHTTTGHPIQHTITCTPHATPHSSSVVI